MDHGRLRHAFNELAAEYATDTGPEITRELTRQLLAAILLRVARLPPPSGVSTPTADPGVPFREFEHEAHSDLPVAVIGRRLGFTEPTNFGKFFTRITGQSPGAFRESQT